MGHDIFENLQVTRILENGVYTIMSSEAQIYANALFIRQTPLSDSEDFDAVCPYQKWTKSGQVKLQGFKDQAEVLECDTKDSSHFTCVPDTEEKDDNDPRSCKYPRDFKTQLSYFYEFN